MIIRLGDLRSDQATLEGVLDTDIFQIDTDGDVRSIGPISCELHTAISGDHLIVDGKLTVPTQLRCVNCLEDFSYQHDFNDYHAEIKIENNNMLDLTEHIRDDILLEIPQYPHCTTGSIPDRVCPMTGPFSFEKQGTQPPSDDTEEESPADIWAALEDLDTKDS